MTPIRDADVKVQPPNAPLHARIVDLEAQLADSGAKHSAASSRRLQGLVEQERFLLTLLSNLPGCVYRCRNDPEWTMEFISEGIFDLTGYPAREFVASRAVSIGKLIVPEDRDRVWQEVQRGLAEHRPFEITYRLLNADGAVRWVNEHGTGVYDEEGNLVALEGFVSDVTSRISTEEALRRRLAAESLIAAISTDFINSPAETLDRAIDDALRQVGLFTGSDRSYVFLLTEDGKTFSNTHEWCAPGAESHLPLLQNLPRQDYRWSWQQLERSEVVHVERLDELPESAASERTLFESGAIRSLMFVPLTFRGAAVGLLGLDAVHNERRWPPEDTVLLRTIGEIIVSALERRRSEEALRESESKYKMLAENTSDFISLHDTEARFLYVSPSVEKVTGYQPNELEGRSAYEIIHPDDRDRVYDEAHLPSLETGEAEITWRFLAKDGPPIWCESRTTLIRDDDGEPYRIVCATRNVTEQKEAESELWVANARQQLLLRELDHRVRNNLASLAALIDISSRDATDVQEFAASVRNRVQAMSTVHGLLSRHRFSSVSLEQLLLSLVPEDLHNQLEYDGDDAQLAPIQGSAMGMILQELVANSLKYGSLSVPDGRVFVRAQFMSDADGDVQRRLDVHWREAGGPRVTRRPEVGLGMMLIRGLVRSELRGKAYLTYPETGARHSFKLHISRVDGEDTVGTSGENGQ